MMIPRDLIVTKMIISGACTKNGSPGSGFVCLLVFFHDAVIMKKTIQEFQSLTN